MKYITKSEDIHIIPVVISILCLIGFYFDYFKHEHSDLLNAIVFICSLLQVYAGFLAALLIILFKHTISDSLRGMPEQEFRESLQISKQYILTIVIQGVYIYTYISNKFVIVFISMHMILLWVLRSLKNYYAYINKK